MLTPGAGGQKAMYGLVPWATTYPVRIQISKSYGWPVQKENASRSTRPASRNVAASGQGWSPHSRSPHRTWPVLRPAERWMLPKEASLDGGRARAPCEGEECPPSARDSELNRGGGDSKEALLRGESCAMPVVPTGPILGEPMGPLPRPRTSAIVFAYEEEAALRQSLPSLLASSVEEIVIMYGGADGSRAYVESIRDPRDHAEFEPDRDGK